MVISISFFLNFRRYLKKIKIKQLRKSRFDQIGKLVNVLFLELFGPEMTLGKKDLNKIRKQWMASARLWMFCAINGRQILGFVTLAESFSFFALGKYGIINELWVVPPERGKGIGTELISFSKEFAKSKNWHRLDVTAPLSNRWQRTSKFYQKNGFVMTGKKLKCLI